MFIDQSFKFDCTNLLEEIEMAYQELCDLLRLPFDVINKTLMRTTLAYALEDTVNKLTDGKFRDHVTLVKNLVTNYLENEAKLNEYDMEDIDEIFVQPILNETMTTISNLLNKADRYYSKWEVRECENFPHMEIIYTGDYRIDEWHQIQNVPSRRPVAVKRHRIRYDDMVYAIRDALVDLDDLCSTDYPEIVADILRYYTGNQVNELYNEIVSRIKNISGDRHTTKTSKAFRQVRSIIKHLESIPSFKRFTIDANVAEAIYLEQTRSVINFDVIMPSKSVNHKELRKEILDEIDQLGYVKEDLSNKVEIIYG